MPALAISNMFRLQRGYEHFEDMPQAEMAVCFHTGRGDSLTFINDFCIFWPPNAVTSLY